MGPEQLSALLDSVRELIAILSPQGNIQFANAGFKRLLGYRTEDLIGKPIASILHGTDVAGVRKCLQELGKNGGEALSKRCQLQSVDGNWRWFEAVARDCSSVPGIEGTVVSFQDVTDLHRMEAERQVISEVVHALNQTANLDELLAGIHQALKKVVSAENCFVALHDAAADTFTSHLRRKG
jgi:PAS domain S-box-containing protein